MRLARRRHLAVLGAADRRPHADRPRVPAAGRRCRRPRSGLEIAATCTVAELRRLRPARPTGGGPAVPRSAADALLASFKIWNAATVGGNVCMSLPAGPMISLTASLEGVARSGRATANRARSPVVDFVTGNHQNVLAPGELLRSIFLPASALPKQFAFRRCFAHPPRPVGGAADRHRCPQQRRVRC